MTAFGPQMTLLAQVETVKHGNATQLEILQGQVEGNAQYHIYGSWDGTGSQVIAGTVLCYGIK